MLKFQTQFPYFTWTKVKISTKNFSKLSSHNKPLILLWVFFFEQCFYFGFAKHWTKPGDLSQKKKKYLSVLKTMSLWQIQNNLPTTPTTNKKPYNFFSLLLFNCFLYSLLWIVSFLWFFRFTLFPISVLFCLITITYLFTCVRVFVCFVSFF